MRRLAGRVVCSKCVNLILVGLLSVILVAAESSATYAPVPLFGTAQGRHTRATDPALRVRSTDKLSVVFDRVGYRLERVRRHGEVPRLFLASLPHDMRDVRGPAARKGLFIKTTLPLILHVNELVERKRQRIILLRALLESGIEIDPADATWLQSVRERYGIDRADFDALLRRVDVVPPSLALAQGAEESGWGTSRFAREGNALFGQRVFRGVAGMVPRKREQGKRHRVRAFGDLIDGVKAYVHNLNTHPAYSGFRRARAAMRKQGPKLDGYRLAGALIQYSERREAYIATIRSIIRVNGLGIFDRAWLGDRVSLSAGAPDA